MRLGERGDAALEIVRDFFARSVGSKFAGAPMETLIWPGRAQRLPAAFNSKMPPRRTGNDGNLQLRGQQADACAKRVHRPSRVMRPFGEDQHVPSAVDQITRKCEALAKSGAQRKRENVVDRDDKPVGRRDRPAPARKPRSRGGLRMDSRSSPSMATASLRRKRPGKASRT